MTKIGTRLFLFCDCHSGFGGKCQFAQIASFFQFRAYGFGLTLAGSKLTSTT